MVHKTQSGKVEFSLDKFNFWSENLALNFFWFLVHFAKNWKIAWNSFKVFKINVLASKKIGVVVVSVYRNGILIWRTCGWVQICWRTKGFYTATLLYAAVSVFRLEANRDVNFHIFHWQMQTFCNPLKHTSVDIQSIFKCKSEIMKFKIEKKNKSKNWQSI